MQKEQSIATQNDSAETTGNLDQTEKETRLRDIPPNLLEQVEECND